MLGDVLSIAGLGRRPGPRGVGVAHVRLVPGVGHVHVPPVGGGMDLALARRPRCSVGRRPPRLRPGSALGRPAAGWLPRRARATGRRGRHGCAGARGRRRRGRVRSRPPCHGRRSTRGPGPSLVPRVFAKYVLRCVPWIRSPRRRAFRVFLHARRSRPRWAIDRPAIVTPARAADPPAQPAAVRPRSMFSRLAPAEPVGPDHAAPPPPRRTFVRLSTIRPAAACPPARMRRRPRAMPSTARFITKNRSANPTRMFSSSRWWIPRRRSDSSRLMPIIATTACTRVVPHSHVSRRDDPGGSP